MVTGPIAPARLERLSTTGEVWWVLAGIARSCRLSSRTGAETGRTLRLPRPSIGLSPTAQRFLIAVGEGILLGHQRSRSTTHSTLMGSSLAPERRTARSIRT